VQLADETARFGRGWLHRSGYTGRWREMVARSAITLKLMTYKPTGAVPPGTRSTARS
jgi:GH15 family glucan-1,4-alpha-glucosidase